MASRRNFIVVGAARGLVLQVLLSIHGFTDADCVVVCAKGTRFLRYTWLLSSYMEVDFSGADDNKFVESVNRLAESTPDIVLIPADCDSARMVNRMRQQLKMSIMPTPDSAMLDCLDNKWRFYQFCKEHGLNAPASRLLLDKHDIDLAFLAHDPGFPFVVKPLDQAGSKGVLVISCVEEFRSKILDNDAYQFAPLIVQRYIDGVDVGLNLLSIKGRVTALAVQQRRYPQHEAAKIDFLSNPYLEHVAHTICRHSGYDGVMNVDARIERDTGKIFLFECNPRFWRSLLASAWCGLNFVAEAIDASAGSEKVHTLSSGCANTFYHPLFRPSLWRYGLFDRGHRGRLVRAMMHDVCLLGSSVVFTVTGERAPPSAASGRRNVATLKAQARP
jgi:predicted ATP-grasp superfamily ATP-dependent carboligase